MATKYNLTTAFTTITETSGTIQNVGAESVELVSSTNAVAGEGIVLNPSEKRSFKGALSARSMGDAGAVVNVVDFTEAGEGGEEYVLPIASDTTLGGVKISNSFTVANDGTLNIKKSGKTILGGVKSSDDEGKVTVNSDGTMTYNPLGSRQPNTTYTAGQIAYHASLPTGWYLECTTPGISGSGDLTISSPSVGGTVTDGTVVWIIRSVQNDAIQKLFMSNADANNIIDAGIYRYDATVANLPTNNQYGNLVVLGVSGYNVEQLAYLENSDGIYHRNRTGLNAPWSPWKQQETIVAKSLGVNGYIKYASGLIVQWGANIGSADTLLDIPLNISMTKIVGATAVYDNSGGGLGSDQTIEVQSINQNSLRILRSAGLLYYGIQWFVIGY